MIKRFSLFLAFCAAARAADVNASTPDQTSIVTAIAAANNGDTIVLPSGTGSFTSTLTVTKSVSFRGQGDTTILSNDISGGSTSSPMIKYTLTADAPVRVQRILFDGNGKPCLAFDNQNTGTAAMSDCRVDHCTFREYGTTPGTAFHAIKAQGYVYGVADHNTFESGVICFEFDDRDGAAWSRHGATTQIGTVNSWVLEDNVVNVSSIVDVFAYFSNGARGIIRYNTITNGDSPDTALVVDCHGNNELVEEAGLRGTIFMEFYNNTWSGRASFQMRGGTMLVHDNTFTNQPFDNSILGVTEEEFCRPGLIGPGYTDYPAGDMLKDSHFWNNTSDGAATEAFIYCDEPDPDPDNHLTEDIDFFNRAPQSGDPAFTFASLTYPHPRVTADDGTPGGSINATILNAGNLIIGTP